MVWTAWKDGDEAGEGGQHEGNMSSENAVQHHNRWVVWVWWALQNEANKREMLGDRMDNQRREGGGKVGEGDSGIRDAGEESVSLIS